MISLYGYICFIFLAEQTLLIAAAMPVIYSRDQLLPLRASAIPLTLDQCLRITQLGLRRRGCRAGNHTRRLRRAACSDTSMTYYTAPPGEIPVVIGHRPMFTNNDQLFSCHRGERCRAESTVCRCRSKATRRCRRCQSTSRLSALRAIPLCRRKELLHGVDELAPSLYVLNAAALSKPHAVDQLAADLASYDIDVAVVTETHLKTKHSDGAVSIPGYSLTRRDRCGRRGGGVAMFVRSTLQWTVWTYAADDRQYELQWVRVGGTFVGALYHPPRPLYASDQLLAYIEACIGDILSESPSASVILAGDLNQLSDAAVEETTGLAQIVSQPTRGPNILDRVFVSRPMFCSVRVVASVLRSDHKAIVALTEHRRLAGKVKTVKLHRKVTPAQHAVFLQYISTLSFDDECSDSDTQTQFNTFYQIALDLLNKFYPERPITVTSRDPDYVTAGIKAKLRRKNRLMRRGRVEEAGALAQRIGKEIIRRSKTRLSRLNPKTGTKDLWAAVRQLTGRRQEVGRVDGVSANSLNDHYALISTDASYCAPPRKLTAGNRCADVVTEWRMFMILDKLRTTATGPDQLPAWFLRLCAPIFCKPLARLFNLSIATAIVPRQWKQASICPVPKTATPGCLSDFRPISITPVLTRIMERIVVSEFLYPAFLEPPTCLDFHDQYAFRPTGSTTAALISLLQAVTDLLLSHHPYVAVIALDFSKAFDTVRHTTLLDKIAKLQIPDAVYNWFVDFFDGHEHCTTFGGTRSSMHSITASIIQGSAIGPASYVVNAADLHTVTDGNLILKYADDTYLLIPASNIQTRAAELQNVEQWAETNNLKLNHKKTSEIIITNRRGKGKSLHSPPSKLPGIERVTSLKILGVTINSKLSVSEHCLQVVSRCAQSLHALRILRSRGMDESALQLIFKTVVLAKVTYASSAWWGYTTAADRHRLEAFLRRAVRARLYPVDGSNLQQLVTDSDDVLFNSILSNEHHVLHKLLPNTTYHTYSLRNRRHNYTLSNKTDTDERNYPPFAR